MTSEAAAARGADQCSITAAGVLGGGVGATVSGLQLDAHAGGRGWRNGERASTGRARRAWERRDGERASTGATAGGGGTATASGLQKMSGARAEDGRGAMESGLQARARHDGEWAAEAVGNAYGGRGRGEGERV